EGQSKGLARGGAASVVKIKSQTPSPQLLANAVGVSPDEKKAYAYYESGSGSFISVIDLKTNNESGIIPLMNVSRLQFEGMSFAQGGKKILIPSDEGLLVYDLKDPKNPTILFTWPIGKVEQVDVTNRGQSFCVSLGQKGLECADFQAPETTPAPAK
ncbi:MAG: hypothetical protein ACD_73C00359G0002, partial [uncultured bacterium]